MANVEMTMLEMQSTMHRMRARMTAIQTSLYSPQDMLDNPRAFATLLLGETNKILDCALDLSKQAATIESAVTDNRGILKG